MTKQVMIIDVTKLPPQLQVGAKDRDRTALETIFAESDRLDAELDPEHPFAGRVDKFGEENQPPEGVRLVFIYNGDDDHFFLGSDPDIDEGKMFTSDEVEPQPVIVISLLVGDGHCGRPDCSACNSAFGPVESNSAAA